MRVAGYIRVSGDKQVDGTSLDVQTSQIQAYCALKGFDLADIFCDPAVSGGKPIESRPEGSKLMASVVGGDIKAVVVSKLYSGIPKYHRLLTDRRQAGPVKRIPPYH